MTAAPSDAWLSVFPAPRIPDVLNYLGTTWDWLRASYADAVAFQHDEPTLTDNLCEALADRDRRLAHRMDCDFQAETWELRRAADGTTSRLARADIRVILGAPGTPHLVIEFKKLDGTTGARWQYCFDGVSRFVEGKYAVGHVFGVMCGIHPGPLADEVAALADYIRQPEHAAKLLCVANGAGDVVTLPSSAAPAHARFDTVHNRPTLTPAGPISLLHMLIPCISSLTLIAPASRPRKAREPRKRAGKATR
ncbi:hypothetical protein [Pleomorphomonas sp. PLEO]|uniref:hypothetical protein n=1 Tax=Pleomorphomonas sp. PLEO TaxID=3239306 RepID=UPI00351F40C0